MRTSLKVIIGYALLLSGLGAALFYIMRFTDTAARIGATEQAVAQHRRASTALLSALLEASTAGETLVLTGRTAQPDYEHASRRANSALTHLRMLTSDSRQRARLDTLEVLMAKKHSTTLRLLETTLANDAGKRRLQQHINNLKTGRDSVTLQQPVKEKVIEKNHEVVVERTKKHFFGRLADAFRPPKNDTTHINHSERVTPGDSSRRQEVNISDTLAGILNSVSRELGEQESKQRKRVLHETKALRLTGNALAQRIAAISEAIETDERKWLGKAVEADRAARHAEARKMGALAAGSAILAAWLFVWVWRDLARAARYRKRLEQEMERTEELMRSREQLLLTITHDIKAPVNSIIGHLDLLGSRPTSEVIDNVRASASHLLRLVQSLLEFYRLEHGNVTITPTPFSPAKLLDETGRSFLPAVQARGLAFFIHIDFPAGFTLLGDAFRLRQVVENLLSNALKFTDNGSIGLSAGHTPDGNLRIEVSDTGCGMSPEDSLRAFTAFTRVAGSEGREGSGLGLSIAKQVVNLMGGMIEVESQEGKGTKFTVEIPMPETNSPIADTAGTMPNRTPSLPPMPRREGSTAPTMHKEALRVGLVDDDTLQLRLSEALLLNVDASLRPEVVPFDRPSTLIAAHEVTPFDLVFTDVEMPEMSGFELARKLSPLPVVATTSHTLLSAGDFRAQGFADVLFKPFTRNDVTRILQSFRKQGPAIPPKPWQPLLAFAEGDTQAEREIELQFLRDTAERAAAFREARVDRNLPALGHIAHKLLPTFTLINSPAVAALRQLEGRGREVNIAWKQSDTELCEKVESAMAALLRHHQHGTNDTL